MCDTPIHDKHDLIIPSEALNTREPHVNCDAFENKSEVPLEKPSLFQGGLVFSIFAILFIASGLYQQNFIKQQYSNLAIILNEIIFVALPPLIFMYFKKMDIKKLLRLNSASFMEYALIFLIMVSSLPIIYFINGVSVGLVELVFGQSAPTNIPNPNSIIALFISFIAIGASAGVCEELLFRGFLFRSFEHFGLKKSILFSGILFSLIHLDFNKILGVLILGVLFAYFVYRTNSIFTAMFAHFLNNSIALTLSFLISPLATSATKNVVQPIASSSEIIAGKIFIWVLVSIFLIASFFVVKWLVKKFHIITSKNNLEDIAEAPLPSDNKWIYVFLPGILAILAIFVWQAIRLYDPVNSILSRLIPN